MLHADLGHVRVHTGTATPPPRPGHKGMALAVPLTEAEHGGDAIRARTAVTLQQTVGNTRMLGQRVQAKLVVGEPNDASEQEADEVANRITETRKPEEAGIPIRRMDTPGVGAAAGGAPVDPVTESRVQGLRGLGHSMTKSDRVFFEARLGHDFGDVRLHTGADAAESAQSIQSVAFTSGRDIAFAPGQYKPDTAEGRKLLAHELTHVVQQGGAPRRQEAAVTATGREPGRTITKTDTKIQRQQPPHQPANPQQTYAQALGRLRTIDPTIHGYISQAPLGGAATTIRTNTETLPGGTIQAVFNLQVQLGPLRTEEARFNYQDPNMTNTGPRTITVPMLITVRSSTNDADSLAAYLYHEGIHMMLYMDQFVRQVSPHTAALATYTSIAQGHPSFPQLLAELEAYIELDLQMRSTRRTPGVPPLPSLPPGYAQHAAQEITAHLIEEKYAFDRERAAFQTSPSNQAIALSYIVDMLTEGGVQARSSNGNVIADVIRMGNLATQVFNAIDNRAAPAAPVPGAPSSTRSAPPPAPMSRPPRSPGR